MASTMMASRVVAARCSATAPSLAKKSKCVHPGKSPKCKDCPDLARKASATAGSCAAVESAARAPALAKKAKCVHPGKSPKCKDCPDAARKAPATPDDAAMSAGAAAALALVFASAELAAPGAAHAAGGAYGILEGRSVALVHPLMMGSLLTYTLYTGYLGWQWRSVRTVGNELAELKKQLPAAPEGGEAPAPPKELAAKIDELTAKRAELAKGGFRDSHFNAGSLLLASGVLFSIEGALNTYLRVGKLFPGPHLFAGAGITVLWALSASLVPAMQKGNEGARNAHIALNGLNVALFAWQVPTGLEIVWKVFQFTKWP